MKRLLVVASNPPGVRHVGEILLADMISLLPDCVIDVVMVVPGPTLVPSAWPGVRSLNTVHTPVPPSRRGWPNRAGGLASMADRFLRHDRAIGGVAKRVEELVDDLEPDLVWCILSSLEVVDVAHHLASRLPRERLRVQVWDDVEHLCAQAGAERFGTRRSVDRALGVMRVAGGTAVISENMGEYYEGTCGARTTVVRQGTAHDVEPLARSDGDFVIGFSGAIYARTAIAALMAALGTVDWCIGGRRVRLRIMGVRVELAFDRPAHVELRGMHEPASLDALLAECDLLYLPQAFEAELRAFTRLSFPTKLSSYAGVGRPVMVHAPPYGSVAEFCSRTGVGALVDSLDAESILGALEPLVTDPNRYAQAAHAAASVGSSALGRDQFRHAIRNFLQC